VFAPDLVIFDCDGVLVDSEFASTRVLAEALSAAAVPTTAAQAYTRYRGAHPRDIAADAQARRGSPLPNGFWERFEHDRARAFRESLQPITDAAETVVAVIAAGISVCVASQGKRSKTDLTLEITDLRGLFGHNALFSAHDVSRGKPFPDLFLHAAASMRTPVDKCLVVEDTTIGVRAAIAAGMTVVGLAGTNDAGPMRKLGAETITSLSDLLPLLRRCR
jgi:HAD superfamily hydrolase (TIGR01509 family)